MTALRASSLGLILVCLVACATAPLRPGALNAFDARAFDTLLVTQAAVEQAKALAETRNEVLAVNAVVASYNLAHDAYLGWREVAAGGAAPSTAALDAQITAVVADVAALIKALTDEPHSLAVEPQ